MASVLDGGAASAAFDINVTSLTLGTATAVLFAIEESYDNGTTWTDIWITDPVTTTGHVRIPAIPLHGRFRPRGWSVRRPIHSLHSSTEPRWRVL